MGPASWSQLLPRCSIGGDLPGKPVDHGGLKMDSQSICTVVNQCFGNPQNNGIKFMVGFVLGVGKIIKTQNGEWNQLGK